ncbi:MAG: DinB family protein, partial [Aggregatilineales bacterium]
DVPWHNLRGTLLHTLDSERGWIRLLRDGKIDYFRNFQPENFPDIATLRARYTAEKSVRDTYLDSLTDANMTDSIVYTVPEGGRSRVLWHCLWHMVNHGSQHRSESALLLTNYGQSPDEIDFLVFVNEQAEEAA